MKHLYTQKKKCTMCRQLTISIAMIWVLSMSLAWGQETAVIDAHAGPGSSAMPMDGMDHKSMSDGDMSMDDMQSMDMDMSGGMDKQDMSGMSSMSMQGGAAPPDARDPHANSDGFDFGPIPRPRFADEYSVGSLLVDNLESVHSDNNSSTAYELQGWYGRDYNRAVLKSEGDIDGGRLGDVRTELLWGHAVATFWDTQLGIRYDSGEMPDRSWLAFGIQGLAPYWFEVDITGYVGDKGRSTLRLSTEYDLMFTQKLILQTRIEADIYGKDDAGRALGSGLSDMAVAIRLRYEIRRELAPYVGIEWTSMFGGTADYARIAGQAVDDTRLVAGLRFWF
jgi:copper resistance protein B